MSAVKSVAFVGLGAMGGPMARNLAKKFPTKTHDQRLGTSLLETIKDVDCVVTALPAAKDVDVVLEAAFPVVSKNTLFIDCTTVSPAYARSVGERAKVHSCLAIDAPMSGGVPGAENGTLTFMVGGDEDAIDSARPILEAMGTNVKRAGPSGSGAGAKICNNMILACHMIAVAEGLHLAEQLVLDVPKIYDVIATATAKSWALNEYPPIPDVGTKTSPANRDYLPGFAASLMAKDLKIAIDSATDAHAYVPLGTHAKDLYDIMLQHDDLKSKDFSAIIRLLRKKNSPLL